MAKEKLFECEIIDVLENEVKFSCNGNIYQQEIDSIIVNPNERNNLKPGEVFSCILARTPPERSSVALLSVTQAPASLSLFSLPWFCFLG